MIEVKDGAAPHMLIRVRSACEAARVRANALKIQQHEEKVIQAGKLVHDAERLMAKGWAKISVLRANGLPIVISQAAAGDLAKLTKKATELAEADVEALVDPKRFEMKRLEQRIKDFAPKLDEAAEDAWKQYWPEQLPKIEELLNFFGNLHAYTMNVARIRQLEADLRRRAERVPVDEKQWQDFHERADTLQRAAAEFTAGIGAELPKAVASFLRRAGSPAGAALHDLTESVREWLRTHDMEADFVVVVRGSA